MIEKMTYWFPIKTVADYFRTSYARVRDDLQQEGLIGYFEEQTLVAEGKAYIWAQRAFGVEAATTMLSDLEPVLLELEKSSVELIEEFDSETDYERPIFI